MGVKRKTSIVIDAELWKEWVTFVVRKYGTSRKISEEIEKALREHLAKYH